MLALVPVGKPRVLFMFRFRLPLVWRCGSGLSTVPLTRRFVSSAKADDKKFHCSICFKAFRLEMAAQLHLKQAHSGSGEVAAGPGPGPSPSVASVQPTAVASVPVEDEEEYRPVRRQRPTPQPLNKSIFDMPPGHMQAMLEVWDRIGSGRLENFVASTSVTRAYAARPLSEADVAPTYKSLAGKGPNPFELAENEETPVVPSAEHCGAVADLDWCPFAVSAPAFSSPFRPKATPSPFVTMASQALPVPAKNKVDGAMTLGSSGPATSEQSTEPMGEALSPFAAAAISAAPSISAAQTASPFGTALSSASPFADVAAKESTASPFAPSPFADGGPDSGSPFSYGGDTLLTSAFSTPGSESTPGHVAASSPVFSCPKCDKVFSSQRGLSDHARVKHNLSLERGEKQTRSTPADLPPYVPSPVDLSMTVPYGNGSADATLSWSEVELYPSATTASNMELLGIVKKMEIDDCEGTGNAGVAVSMVVCVESDDGETEEIPVRVYGKDLSEVVRSTVVAGVTVAAAGTLRLNPWHDAQSNKYFASPAVHVTSSTGTIQRVL